MRTTPRRKPANKSVITVTSGYGGNTHLPFVQMTADLLTKPLQISPDDARSLAQNLLQAAEAADQDGFMFEFFNEELHQDPNVCANILNQYRQWREMRRGKQNAGL